MDLIFLKFEQWYKNKEVQWKEKGVLIEKTHYEEQRGHHYAVSVKSENGLGNLVLYENNDYYWIDMEAGNYDFDTMFIRSDIRFNELDDVNSYLDEWIEHIAWSGN